MSFFGEKILVLPRFRAEKSQDELSSYQDQSLVNLSHGQKNYREFWTYDRSFRDHSKSQQTSRKILYNRVQKFDGQRLPCGHVTAGWTVNNQSAFMNICSIPWSCEHVLWQFGQKPSCTSGFRENWPRVNISLIEQVAWLILLHILILLRFLFSNMPESCIYIYNIWDRW